MLEQSPNHKALLNLTLELITISLPYVFISPDSNLIPPLFDFIFIELAEFSFTVKL
jgi:hypothetical protein